MRKLALLLASSALLLATEANANVINIGLSLDGNPIQTFAGSAGSASITGQPFGGFTINASGTGSPPNVGGLLLDGNTISVSSLGSTSVLHVFVTESQLTTPLGLQQLESSFTQNILTSGWTVLAQTFADNTNTPYGMQQALSSVTFTTGNQAPPPQFITANLGAGMYSITEEWTITSNGIAGQTSNTTDMAAVPGPVVGAGLPGLLAMLGGGWFLRRRKQAA